MSRVQLYLLVAWAGSLWTVGFLVAPTLFGVLDDPALAGRLAARFFAAETWLSIAAAALWIMLTGGGQKATRSLAVAIAAVLCVMHFGVAPFMSQVSWGHSVAAGLYLVACALAGILVFKCPSRAG